MNSFEIFKNAPFYKSFKLGKSEDLYEVFNIKQSIEPIREKLNLFDLYREFGQYEPRDNFYEDYTQGRINLFRNHNGDDKENKRQIIIYDIKKLMLEYGLSDNHSNEDVIERFLRQEYRNLIKDDYLRRSDDPIWHYKSQLELHVDLYNTLFENNKFNITIRELSTELSKKFDLPIKIVTDVSNSIDQNHDLYLAQQFVKDSEELSECNVGKKEFYNMPLIKIDNKPVGFNPIVYFSDMKKKIPLRLNEI